jgi:hypothetical protein
MIRSHTAPRKTVVTRRHRSVPRGSIPHNPTPIGRNRSCLSADVAVAAWCEARKDGGCCDSAPAIVCGVRPADDRRHQRRRQCATRGAQPCSRAVHPTGKMVDVGRGLPCTVLPSLLLLVSRSAASTPGAATAHRQREPGLTFSTEWIVSEVVLAIDGV